MTEQRTYANFDLLIEGLGADGYRARVLESPAGGAAGSFTSPFTEMELELFLLKVGRPRRGTRRLESPEMDAAREFGKKLYDAVFNDDLKLSLRRSLDEVERRDEGLRIRLRFSDAPVLASLPWEFLYDDVEDQFLALSAWTPIVRHFHLTQRVEPLTVEGPLRILTMISSPHDFDPLDVDQEWRRIELALQPLIEQGSVVLDRTDEATLLELQRRLRRSDYHVFHFVGHGGFDEKSDDGVLVMEDGSNRSRLVAGRNLGTILNDHRSLRLVVLNSCEGARSSDADLFSGAAQSVVRKGIPAVVAMQFEITDAAAIAFAHEFYGAIADSYPVDAAIGEARRAIFGLGNDIEWGTPVVYMLGDGRLFDVHHMPLPDADKPAQVSAVTEAIGADVVAEAGIGPRGVIAERLPDSEVGPSDSAPSLPGEEEIAVGVSEPEVDEGPADGTPSWQGEEAADIGLASRTAVGPRLARRQMRLPIAIGMVVAGVVLFLAWRSFGGDVSTQTETTSQTSTTATTGTAVIAADGAAVAQWASESKAIDGIANDWPNAIYHTTDHLIYYNPAVRDDPSARGGAGNESLIQLAWDETHLYVFAQVEDDIVAVPGTADQIWRNDAVNLNISVIGPDGVISETVDDDDHQLTLDANGASAHYVIGGDALSLGFADVAVVRSSSGYVLEASLPWAEIGVVSPRPGDRFGLLLTVFDNDNDFPQAEIKANTPPWGEQLDNRWFRSPQTWGHLTLEGCEGAGEVLQTGCIEVESAHVEYSATPTLTPPGPLADSDGASGSGCAPGQGPLPDGAWFGFAEEVAPGEVILDLACYFYGDAANRAAEEDGVEEVPDGYYIRNHSDTLRTVPVSATAVVHTLGSRIDDGFETLAFSDWSQQSGGFLPCPGTSCSVWLYVNGGQVTEIVEQYTP